MTRLSLASRNPDIIASVKALRRSARRALDLGLSTGTPVYVIRGGVIVDLTREASAAARHQAAATVREAPAAYGSEGAVRIAGRRPEARRTKEGRRRT